MFTNLRKIVSYFWNDFMKKVIFLITLLFSFSIPLNATEKTIYPWNLWKGILRETIGEDKEAMVAVTLCYKNRLKNKMHLGCTSLMKKGIDKWIEKNTTVEHRELAKKIVEDVFEDKYVDVTKGATFYDNFEEFGIPKFARDRKGNF